MKCLHQCVLIGSLLPLSWLGMMVVHESGHVVGAWLTGGTVERIVAHPFTFSRTDLSQNPRPLLVAWAGPVGGALFPLGALGLTYLCRVPGRYLLRFFAGFSVDEIASTLNISRATVKRDWATAKLWLRSRLLEV